MSKFQRIYWAKDFDWDSYSKLYDKYAKSKGSYYLQTSSKLIDSVKLAKSSKVLDLACGTGALSMVLLKQFPGVNILAVDLSKEMLKYYKKNLSKQVKNGQIVVKDGNAEGIDKLSEEKYDVIFVSSALWDLEIESFVKSAKGVLKNGGKIVFNLPSLVVEKERGFIYFIEHFFRQTLQSDIIYRRIPIDYLKKIFEKNGFKLSTMKDYSFNMSKKNVTDFFDVLRYRYPFILFPKEMPYPQKLKRCTEIFNDSLRYVPKEGLDEEGVIFVFEKN